MIIPCEEKLFLKYAEEFIFNIYQNDEKFNNEKKCRN